MTWKSQGQQMLGAVGWRSAPPRVGLTRHEAIRGCAAGVEEGRGARPRLPGDGQRPLLTLTVMFLAGMAAAALSGCGDDARRGPGNAGGATAGDVGQVPSGGTPFDDLDTQGGGTVVIPVDAGEPPPCGGCPEDRPVCNGVTCLCDDSSCATGTWCDGASCQPCTTSEHCTEACVSCLDLGQVCTADGAACVACDEQNPCPGGGACEQGACVACSTPERCGASCEPCGGETPACAGGACVCNDESCPVGEFCANGACAACATETHCGFECIDCTATNTPVCTNGQCVCTEDGQCGAGSYCSGGACVTCTANDPDHCGATCAVCGGSAPVCEGGVCACTTSEDCGESYTCIGGGCELCDNAQHCGKTCTSCSGATPECDGAQCVCTETSCAGGQLCDGDVCVSCTDSDSAHCGPACLDCTGTSTPVCQGGVCVCTSDADCGEGKWCKGGTCAACSATDADHCGAQCLVCEGPSPACKGGACVCAAESCGAGAFCGPEGGCQPCDTADKCGAACEPCPTEAPLCKALACAPCASDAECGDGMWCNGGACVACGQDDPAHCGASCASCANPTPVCKAGACVCNEVSCKAGSLCEGGACKACKDAAHCGPACAPCKDPLPFCAADGSGCVECETSTHCPNGLSCVEGLCTLECAPGCCAGDLAPNAKKCSSPVIVGREPASVGAYYMGDTYGDGDNDDLPSTLFGSTKCWDGNDDNFYRIYLLAGEKLDVLLSPLELDFDAMLKLYSGTDCAGNGDDDLVDCYQSKYDGGQESFSYVAAATGFYTIVVDGRSAFDDEGDFGEYNIVFTLTCNEQGCACQ